jgi:hypothetical protein
MSNYHTGQTIGIPGTAGSLLGALGQYGVIQGVMYPINNYNGTMFPHPGEKRIPTIDGGTVSTQTLWYQRGRPSDYRGPVAG